MKRKHFLQQLGVVSLGKLILPDAMLASDLSAGINLVTNIGSENSNTVPKPAGSKLFTVDYPALLARAEINYAKATTSEEEGLPIGNGNMGTLVWTDPTDKAKILFQINRNDTFGQDRTHVHYDDTITSGPKVETTDNVLSLCRLGIHIGSAIFQSQTQKTADGTVSINYVAGSGSVEVMSFVSANDDVLIAKIDDRRATAEEINFEVSMVRRPHEVNGQNVRDYSITETNGRILVVQTVREGDFYMQYAVAISIRGNKIQIVEKNADQIKFKTEPLGGAISFFLSTAATMYEPVEVTKKALALLYRIERQGAVSVLNEHRAWWQNFWEKGRTFVQLSSDDGVADYLEARYYLNLYQTASAARGNLPQLFNHGLWFSKPSGDRTWGGQYKFMNDLMIYMPLYAANYIELTDAYLGMYRRMLPDCEIAAKQRWGVKKGAYFPESLGPSGPVILSPRAAPMIHDVLMGKRSRASLPPEVIKECLSEATLDWINPRFKAVRDDQFSWLSHLLSSGGQLAMQYYWRYKYTGDVNWLHNSAYPMMKSIVDFYHSFATKGADGKYHIMRTNVHESYWGVRDGIVDLAAIRTLTPKVIACSKILGVDSDKRAAWAEFVQNLNPYPPGNDPDVVRLQSPGPTGRGKSIPLFPPGTFGAGYLISSEGRQNFDPVWVWPVHPFEDISLVKGRYSGTSEDKDNFEKMLLTYKNVPPTYWGFMWPQYAARLGLTDEVRKLFPLYAVTVQKRPNGMAGSWGSAESGLLAEAIQSALMQSVEDIIVVAPAWPAEWRASFTLLASGGFLVSATLENGAPSVIQIESTFGKTCRIVNPWFPAPAFLRGTTTAQKTLTGQILTIALTPGESVIMVGESVKILSLPIIIRPVRGPVVKKLQAINPKGKIISTQLGKE